MAKTFTYDRFDRVGSLGCMIHSDDGEYVTHFEAINREAVNADRIRVLELQLKESRAKCKGLEQFLDNTNETNKKLTLHCTHLNNLHNDAMHDIQVKNAQLKECEAARDLAIETLKGIL